MLPVGRFSVFLPGRPTQASIDKLFQQATAIRVFKSGVARGRLLGGELLYEQVGADEELRQVLKISQTDVGFTCWCRGNFAVEFVSGAKTLKILALHHHDSILHPDWNSHARLLDGKAFAYYLAARGVPFPLEDFKMMARQNEEARQRMQVWTAAAPAFLRHLLMELQDDSEGAYRLVKQNCCGNDEAFMAMLKWWAQGRHERGSYYHEDLPFAVLERFPQDQIEIFLNRNQQDPVIGEAVRMYRYYKARNNKAR